jgi:hypothetical protein
MKHTCLTTAAALLLFGAVTARAVSFPIGYMRMTWSGSPATITLTEIEPYTVVISPSGKGRLSVRPATRTPQPDPIRIDKIIIDGAAESIRVKFPTPTEGLLIDWLTNPLAVVSFIGAIDVQSCNKISVRGGNLGHPLYSENRVVVASGATRVQVASQKTKYNGHTFHYGGDIYTDISLPSLSDLSVLTKGGNIDVEVVSALQIKKIFALGVRNTAPDFTPTIKGGSIRGVFTASGTALVYQATGQSTASNFTFQSGIFARMFAKGGRIDETYVLGSRVKSVRCMPITIQPGQLSTSGMNRLWLYTRGDLYNRARLGIVDARGGDIENSMLQVRDAIKRISAQSSRTPALGGAICDSMVICGTVGDVTVNTPPSLSLNDEWHYFLGDTIDEPIEASDRDVGDLVRFGLEQFDSSMFCSFNFATGIWFSVPVRTNFTAQSCLPGYFIIPVTVHDNGRPPGFQRAKVRYYCYANVRPVVTTDIVHVNAVVGDQITIDTYCSDANNDYVKFSYEPSSVTAFNSVDYDTANFYASYVPNKFTAYVVEPGEHELHFSGVDNGTPNAPAATPTVVLVSVAPIAGAPVPQTARRVPGPPAGPPEGLSSDSGWLWWWFLEGHFPGDVTMLHADDALHRVTVKTGVPPSRMKAIQTTENTYDCVFESHQVIPIRMLDNGLKDTLADPAHSNVFVPGYR